MGIEFSPIADSKIMKLGDVEAFSSASLLLAQLEAWASPLATVDHFRLRGRPFLPHPHAGFSAIAYVLEDSETSMRTRDSLGNDLITGPGGVLWTQAGKGVVHEDTTIDLDTHMHGVQIFVNLSARNKQTAPQVMQLPAGEVPEWHSGAGDRVRVAAGSYKGISSPLTPIEPFTLLQADLKTTLHVPLEAGNNLVVFVMEGAVRVRAGGEAREVRAAQAVGLYGDPADVAVEAIEAAALLIFSGARLNEPSLRHGNAYIMNSQAEIDAALARYEAGEMGRLTARAD